MAVTSDGDLLVYTLPGLVLVIHVPAHMAVATYEDESHVTPTPNIVRTALWWSDTVCARIGFVYQYCPVLIHRAT